MVVRQKTTPSKMNRKSRKRKKEDDDDANRKKKKTEKSTAGSDSEDGEEEEEGEEQGAKVSLDKKQQEEMVSFLKKNEALYNRGLQKCANIPYKARLWVDQASRMNRIFHNREEVITPGDLTKWLRNAHTIFGRVRDYTPEEAAAKLKGQKLWYFHNFQFMKNHIQSRNQSKKSKKSSGVPAMKAPPQAPQGKLQLLLIIISLMQCKLHILLLINFNQLEDLLPCLTLTMTQLDHLRTGVHQPWPPSK